MSSWACRSDIRWGSHGTGRADGTSAFPFRASVAPWPASATAACPPARRRGDAATRDTGGGPPRPPSRPPRHGVLLVLPQGYAVRARTRGSSEWGVGVAPECPVLRLLTGGGAGRGRASVCARPTAASGAALDAIWCGAPRLPFQLQPGLSAGGMPRDRHTVTPPSTKSLCVRTNRRGNS